MGDHRFYERWKVFGPVTTKRLKDATIVVVDQSIEVDMVFFKSFPEIQYLVTPTTGHTHIKHLPEGVNLLSLRGETDFLQGVRSVSEFTFKLILDIYRNAEPPLSLNGKILGIVGLGRIGQQVREIARAFNMQVLTIDKNDPRVVWRFLFQNSDIVTLHLPEEAATQSIVGRRYLSMMKPDAYLINTSKKSLYRAFK